MKIFKIIISTIVIVVVILFFGWGVAVSQEDMPEDLSNEEFLFAKYALRKSKADDFENHFFNSIGFNIVLTNINISNVDKICNSHYFIEKTGDTYFLDNQYTATVKLKTFFGITLAKTKIYCE